MAIGYKYAERDADSQINWAEVGKNLSDMLAETNRIREEKKEALATAQREAINYISETPNGEHVGARESVLEYSDIAANRMRIADQLMRSGQMSVKDYTIFRQNIIDNTKLAFNANKAFQENYADVMQGLRDKKYSGLLGDNYEEVQGFGNWSNIGWEISPNGVVMAGKMKEEIIDGKKVRTLDKSEGSLRSMNYLNQAILSKIETYDYESQIKNFTDQLGKNKEVLEFVRGTIGKQGKIVTREFIASRKDIDEQTKKIMYDFLDSEDAKVKEIVGRDLDTARILRDSAVFAPNGEQYVSTTDAKLAKTAPHYILKTVDPQTGGFIFKPTKEQYEQAEKFVKDQMRAQYDKIVGADVISQAQRQDRDYDAANKSAKEQSRIFGEMAGRAVTSKNLAERQEAISFLDTKLVGTGFRVQNNPIGYDKGVYILDETTGEMMNLTRGKDTKTAVAALISGINEKLEEKYQEDIANTFGLRISRGKNVSDISTGQTRIKAGAAMSKYNKKQQQ